VYFGRSVLGAGYVFRPADALAFGAVADSLFVRTSFGHYYFGNYYGRSYVGLGFQPWAGFAGRNYDPVFAYERWANRANPHWASGLNATYAGRASGTLAGPSRTTVSLDQLRQAGQKFVPVSTAQRTRQTRNAQQMVQRSLNMTRSTTARAPNATADSRPAAGELSSSGRSAIQGLIQPPGGGRAGANTSSIVQGLTKPRSGIGPTTSFRPPLPTAAATPRPNLNSALRSLPSGRASGAFRSGSMPVVGGGHFAQSSGGGAGHFGGHRR
jgi:hypothetical protein